MMNSEVVGTMCLSHLHQVYLKLRKILHFYKNIVILHFKIALFNSELYDGKCYITDIILKKVLNLYKYIEILHFGLLWGVLSPKVKT